MLNFVSGTTFAKHLRKGIATISDSHRYEVFGAGRKEDIAVYAFEFITNKRGDKAKYISSYRVVDFGHNKAIKLAIEDCQKQEDERVSKQGY